MDQVPRAYVEAPRRNNPLFALLVKGDGKATGELLDDIVADPVPEMDQPRPRRF